MIFSKNVLMVMTGTVFGQLIPVIASPFLARLYGGEQFGVLALYITISSLFVMVACGRYEVAIVLPAEDSKALNLVGLSLLITIGTATVSFLLMFFLGTGFSFLFKESLLKFYLLFVPVSVIAMGVYQTFYNWGLRAKKFRSLSTSRIIQSVFTVAASITFAYTGTGLNGLILGFIVGQIAGAIFISISVLPNHPINWNSINASEMKDAARHYKDFPRVNTAHALLDSFQNYGITFLLSFYFGNVILGWYSFSYRILRAPLAFIGAAYAQVLYPEMSEMKNKGIAFRPVIIQTLKKISLIGFPIFLLLAFFAPAIFRIVFGQQWEEAGTLAQCISPWLFVNLICSPVSQVPNILNKQKKAFLINLIGVIAGFTVFLSGIYLHGTVEKTFLFFSLTSALYLAYFTFWIVKISDYKKN